MYKIYQTCNVRVFIVHGTMITGQGVPELYLRRFFLIKIYKLVFSHHMNYWLSLPIINIRQTLIQLYPHNPTYSKILKMSRSETP